MKRQAKNRILASVISLLLVLSLIGFVPYTNVQADSSSATQASVSASTTNDYNLADSVQDGVILQAWNWSYSTIQSHLEEIANAGFTTIQTSPVQQPKDYDPSYTTVGDNWWKFYQPLSFSIATKSWLGTEDDLKALCTAADKYGIKIICDIVANHMADDGGDEGLDPHIANYEPDIYNNYSKYVHSFRGYDENSIAGVVQGNIGQPDMNTGDSDYQGKVIGLLKQCIDCGVDGFRFDAAKHIETPTDPECASNFWSNVIGTATSYAKSNKGIDLYCYGETLDSLGPNRSYSSYTSIMSVTDNKTSNNVRGNVASGNASGAAASGYVTGQSASRLVLWDESHDTYEDGSSTGVSTSDLNKTWAIVGSRADATAFYFARPENASMGQCGSTEFKASEVSAVNKFHNYFVGTYEYLSSSNGVVMNERYTTKGDTDGGVVLVNVNGNSTTVSNMTVNRLGDGTYVDQITNNKFTVSNGKISGQIGSTGIAVVYNPKEQETSPAITVNPAGKTFTTDTLDITIGLSNATSGTYQIGSDGDVVTYTSTKTITIGADMEDGDSKTITFTATDGTKDVQRTETYIKSDVDMVSVYFTNNYGWSNVYAYYWGGENPSSAWPGNQMTYVEDNEFNQAVYKIEVPTDVTGLIFTNGSGAQTVNITSGIAEKAGFYISGGSSSAYTVGTYVYDGGDEPEVEDITVYFKNNYSWNNVYAYYWGGSSASVTWPGTEMTYVGTDDDGYGIYSISIPSDVTGLIFDSGSNGAQTQDITSGIFNGVAFYISGGDSSAYTVTSYVY